MVAISGNTYPVRGQLKALGGRWNADQRAWMVPDNQAEKARSLLGGKTSATTSTHRHGNKQCACTEQGCCRPKCFCSSSCACKGGPIFDCMG